MIDSWESGPPWSLPPDLPPVWSKGKGSSGASVGASQAAVQAAGVCCLSARCGRAVLSSTRHASMTCCASSSDANQCWSRHSARTCPLNDSAKALSVGFPGPENSSCTPFRDRPGVEGHRDELRPVVDGDPLGRPDRPLQPLQDRHDALPRQGDLDLDGGTHAAHMIHYRQDPKTPPVGQAVGQEDAQPFLPVEPLDALVVDVPPLPPQQDVPSAVAGADPRGRQVPGDAAVVAG